LPWDWRAREENVSHRPDLDPERKAAIKLTFMTLGFLAALLVLFWALYG
jgi:hypothetical protein